MINLNVEHIMTEHVVTIPQSTNVAFAAHILMRQKINGLFITPDNDRKKIIGVFTTTDLLKLLGEALTSTNKKMSILDSLGKEPVKQYMSKSVEHVQKDTKIAKIIGVMHKKNIHTIPVYDGDSLVGVVGRHDILNVAFSS